VPQPRHQRGQHVDEADQVTGDPGDPRYPLAALGRLGRAVAGRTAGGTRGRTVNVEAGRRLVTGPAGEPC
jgi:hypothetical protein